VAHTKSHAQLVEVTVCNLTSSWHHPSETPAELFAAALGQEVAHTAWRLGQAHVARNLGNSADLFAERASLIASQSSIGCAPGWDGTLGMAWD